MGKKEEKLIIEAHQRRQATEDQYNRFNIEPTEVAGITVRSRLEALWLEELQDCDHFKCVECTKVPIWIQGAYGPFLSNYTPDFVVENNTNHERVFIELKPNKDLALGDDRQQRALELNPRYRFIVIGGYPYSRKGVTVRLLTGKQEIVHHGISVCQVLEFLGCRCKDQ
jgi:hypothetical protein